MAAWGREVADDQANCASRGRGRGTDPLHGIVSHVHTIGTTAIPTSVNGQRLWTISAFFFGLVLRVACRMGPRRPPFSCGLRLWVQYHMCTR